MEFMDQLARYTERIRNRISGMIARGTGEVISESGRVAVTIDLGNGDIVKHIPLLQSFGFASIPSGKVTMVVEFMGGNRANGVVTVAEDLSKRPAMEKGETVWYGIGGNKAVMRVDGTIELFPAAGKKVIVNGDMDVVGTIDGLIVQAGPSGLKTHLLSHTHAGNNISPTPGT